MTAQELLSVIDFYNSCSVEFTVILYHTVNMIKLTLHILKALTDLKSAVLNCKVYKAWKMLICHPAWNVLKSNIVDLL